MQVHEHSHVPGGVVGPERNHGVLADATPGDADPSWILNHQISTQGKSSVFGDQQPFTPIPNATNANTITKHS